jgi:hypothetical protein
MGLKHTELWRRETEKGQLLDRANGPDREN